MKTQINKLRSSGSVLRFSLPLSRFASCNEFTYILVKEDEEKVWQGHFKTTSVRVVEVKSSDNAELKRRGHELRTSVPLPPPGRLES